jgi:hypothetical protein
LRENLDNLKVHCENLLADLWSAEPVIPDAFKQLFAVVADCSERVQPEYR